MRHCTGMYLPRSLLETFVHLTKIIKDRSIFFKVSRSPKFRELLPLLKDTKSISTATATATATVLFVPHNSWLL